MKSYIAYKEDPSVKDEFESLLITDELSEGLLYQFARKGVYHTKLVNEYKKKIPKRMKSRSTSKTKYTKINYKKITNAKSARPLQGGAPGLGKKKLEFGKVLDNKPYETRIKSLVSYK